MINYPEKAVYTYDDLVDILRILRAPGRVVEGEALRLVLPGEPTNDSELPQA